MKLEVRITQNTHFRTIETFNFHFFGDSNWRDCIANFEPDIRHHEPEYCNGSGIDQLHDELREVTVEQTTPAVLVLRAAGQLLAKPAQQQASSGAEAARP